MTYTATYSPEDNKLRLYASSRLDAETYARAKKAGFRWAPMQKLFYAVWCPYAEDLCKELAGEIGDEDTTLVQRAEERAERFEEYSENRAADADRAHKAVAAIADNIPLGQPILVGHHSERHARRDAEKIENGMRRAVKMWETSKYWTDRAAGALHNAKYKERPDVRARRIKGLESDIRVYRAKFTPDPRTKPQMWEDGEHVYCSTPTGGRGGSWVKSADLPRIEAHYTRWIKHCENRLAYERAMLAESGGLAADKFNIELGGKVLIGGEWVTVLRINRKEGAIISLSTTRRYCPVIGIEEVKDYRAADPADTAAVKAASKLPPMCNYPTPDCLEMTKAKWDDLYKDHKGSKVIKANDQHAEHRVRWRYSYPTSRPVFITDAKRVDPPGPTLTPAPELPQFVNEPDIKALEARAARLQKPEQPSIFDAMKDTLKQGVQVVTAPQLFPTPPDVARMMANRAGQMAGLRVLEPSAGTGNLIRAIMDNATGFDCVCVVAVEYNQRLVSALVEQRQKTLYANENNFVIRSADFLECNGDLGKFDRVLMNPPFQNGDDIKHIKHALTFLKPGGRLVAICAGGPRQERELQPLCDSWEPLPAGTFKESGTNVNTVLLTITA